MITSCIVRYFAVCLTFCYTGAHGRLPKRITGGVTARIEDFPHQVSISHNEKGHECAGSIIDNTHILTAAHCLVAHDHAVDTDLEVFSGASNLLDRITSKIYEVIMIIYHKSFNPEIMWKDDIAILKLDRPIIFSLFQKPIALPTYDVPVGAIVKVSGWGVFDVKTRVPSEDLQQLDMFVINNEMCTNAFIGISSKHLCTVREPGLELSYGDSGSSLIYDNQIVGIVCSGASKIRGYPSVFTRVYEYKRWIKNVIRRY